MITKIDKSWGYEEIVEQNEHYIIKRLVVYAGKRLSKQYHEKKTETLIPVNGGGSIAVSNKMSAFVRDYFGYYPIHIKPKEVHRISGNVCGQESAVFIEVSTPELNDVVRIEDDYGRAK